MWWSCQSPGAHCCSLLHHLNSFHGGMFKCNAKSDAYLSLYSLSHFECNRHTVHMLTRWYLPPPLTSTAKLSLLTQAHSSPLALATRLHQCHSNHSHCINNSWTFSRSTSYSAFLLVLCFIFKKLLPRSMSKNVSSMFYSRSFTVSILTFKPLIHFELTFLCMRYVSSFIFLHVEHHLLKRSLISHCMFLQHCGKSVDCTYVEFFLNSLFPSIGMYVCFYAQIIMLW